MVNSFFNIEDNMKIEEQYKQLLTLKEELNNRLKDLNFEKIKELTLYLSKLPIYHKLKSKDNQLIALEYFLNIWLQEKKKLEIFGLKEDVFTGIHSLGDIEEKYTAIKYAVLRLENRVPEAYCEQAINELIDLNVSGIAIGKVIVSETSRGEENLLSMACWMKAKSQLVTAITLLQYGAEVYPNNDDLLLQQADCWIEAQQWGAAYECLKRIEEPNAEIQELIEELEKAI